MQIDEALGSCTTITVTYSSVSTLDSLSEEVDSLSAQAMSDNANLDALETDASSGCEMNIQTSFSLTSTSYINLNSISDLDADISLDSMHPSPPPPPPYPPSSPSVPPVTMEAVNDLLSRFSGDLTESEASEAVDTLGSMLVATSGGGSGSEVAAALVSAVLMVSGALLGEKEVGAPPTLVVSADLQIAVELRSPADMAKSPFIVPSAGGGSSSAGVAVPGDMSLPDVDGIGTVLVRVRVANPCSNPNLNPNPNPNPSPSPNPSPNPNPNQVRCSGRAR